MPWCEQIPIKRHLTAEDLELRIKSLKKDGEILRRLYFVKFRYGGENVEKAAERIGISKNEGYIWQRKWNAQGYEGLVPQYDGGRPSKLSLENRNKLKEMLGEKSTWTTDEVRVLIHNEFGVEYTLKQIRIILKKFNMNYAKPLTQDYRRPENAEEILKKNLPEITPGVTIGFFDQSSPQTTANTQRFWSFDRPVLIKNTAHLRANTFGFYSINGQSVVEHHDHSKKEDVCRFFGSIRKANPDGDIIIILDNFRSHHAHLTLAYARQNRIILVFLPPYSPDLNPIEYIWKSIKRIISRTFIRDLDHMKQIIVDAFKKYSSSLSFARAWITKFLGDDFSIIS